MAYLYLLKVSKQMGKNMMAHELLFLPDDENLVVLRVLGFQGSFRFIGQ